MQVWAGLRDECSNRSKIVNTFCFFKRRKRFLFRTSVDENCKIVMHFWMWFRKITFTSEQQVFCLVERAYKGLIKLCKPGEVVFIL